MLKVSKLTFNLHFNTKAKLPYWMGSMFRGGLGQCLKMITKSDKKDSLFYHMYLREESKKGYSKPPKPVILIPPFFGKSLEIEKDANLSLDAIVLGNYARFIPELILGMKILGRIGLGSDRHYDINKFEITNIVCGLSGNEVYDGSSLMLSKISSLDVKDLPLYDKNTSKIGFKTPFTGKQFPPSPERLLWLIRHRLILFVNEYGSEEKIKEFACKGKILNYTTHKHILKRRSMRSEKVLFKGYTGIVEYEFYELDDVAKWLLNVGFLLGLGPDSSFGCGFIQDMLC